MTEQEKQIIEGLFSQQLSLKDYPDKNNFVHDLFLCVLQKENENGYISETPTMNEIMKISQLIDYTIGEKMFMDEFHPEVIYDETERGRMVLSIEKRFNRHLKYANNTESSTGLGYYHPIVSSISFANTFFMNMNKPLARTNPNYSLVNDLFETLFRKIDAYANMIELGLYSDAFVSWRTIHESECILKLLVEGGEKTRRAYTKHLAYNNALRNEVEYITKEQRDKVFEVMKGEMKDHGLKSKDMKKFIEYGWLYSHPKYDPNDIEFKLNFRDGIEKLAGLDEFSKFYEGASEITHSSTVFFYVNDDYCKEVSLYLVFGSAIRIYKTYMNFMSNFFRRNKVSYEEGLNLIIDVEEIHSLMEEKIKVYDLPEKEETNEPTNH